MKRLFVCSATLYELTEARNEKEATKKFSESWNVPSRQVTVKTQKEFEKELRANPLRVRLSWRKYVRRWHRFKARAKERARKRSQWVATENTPAEEKARLQGQRILRHLTRRRAAGM